MQVHKHQDLEFITAPGVKEYGYRPGYVNSVQWREVDTGWFRLYYTDGYKTQLLDDVQGRHNAIARAEDAITNGAGGGFTSYFRPNK